MPLPSDPIGAACNVCRLAPCCLRRLECIAPRLLDFLRMQAAISVEQLRAKRCERGEVHCLIRVFDVLRTEDIVEDRSETAQLLEGAGIKFHVHSSSPDYGA